MKTFDDEQFIIDLFARHAIEQETLFFGNWFSCLKLYNSIVIKKQRHNWCASFGKDDPPPDFYNDKLRVSMEVMRLDDLAFVDEKNKIQNPTQKEEHRLLSEKFGKNYKHENKNLSCLINVSSTLQDCSYERYIANFSRVIGKHSNKLGLYKDNHPGHKIAFFVLDESLMHYELAHESDYQYFQEHHNANCGMYGRPHRCFVDKRFVDIIINCGADYLIWYAPYKWIEFEPNKGLLFDQIAFYDIKHCKKIKTKEYNTKRMIAI